MVAGIGQTELIQIGIIVVSSYVLVQIGKATIRRSIRKTYKDPSDADTKVTGLKFLYNTLSFLIYTIAVIAIIYSIPSVNHIGKTLFAGAGIFAAILGFASQQAFSNIIGGIFLVLFKPFRIGDLIKVGTLNEGYVEDITLRHTVIKDFENKRIVIPNALISTETIHNSHLEDARVMNRIHFGISYDSNLDNAIDIIKEHAIAHKLSKDYRSASEIEDQQSQVDVRVIAWADSAITLRAYIWTDSQEDGFLLKTDLYYSVKKEFEANGIEIPYPHRTIVYKNNEQK
ncbi:MAG: small conductance mechanosensitive channel [Bacteroidia bacterium]|jgi:small conductance mechanosensitive channel